MPLDGHAYLVSQGWEGKGSGLRKDAIANPLAVLQKKTLSGVGKDRDEAFPFWDHVFSAAASAIKIRTTDSDDDSDPDAPIQTFSLQRTTTGIISNRRPATGTPALSSTPTPSGSSTPTPRISVMAAAKQEAARRTLYSMFFRGPVMRSDEVTPTFPEDAKREKEGAEGAADRLNQIIGGDKRSRKETETERVGAVAEERRGKEKGKKARSKEKRERVESREERRARKRRKRRESGDSITPSAPGSGGDLEDNLPTDKATKTTDRQSHREKRIRKEMKKQNEAKILLSKSDELASSLQNAVLPVVTNTEGSSQEHEKSSEDYKTRKKRRKTSTTS